MTKEEIMEAIENMTVLELSELVKAMEEKFGVSAAAPVAVAAAGAAAGAAAEEKTEFTVVLSAVGVLDDGVDERTECLSFLLQARDDLQDDHHEGDDDHDDHLQQVRLTQVVIRR